MNRRERKKEETKQNIIKFAVKLFKEKGFKETLMEDISEAVDISKGTLYNYFPDKESILVGYFQNIIANDGKEVNYNFAQYNDIKFQLSKVLEFIQSILDKNDDLIGIYFRHRIQSFFEVDPFDNSSRSGIENYILEILKNAQIKNEIRSDVSLVILARTFMCMIVSFFVSNSCSKEPLEIEILKSQIIELFLKGVRS